MKYQSRKKAIILLADGTIFYGKAVGKEGSAFGEVCFNTGMKGYQEVFNDSSYFGQLMVTTNAHIGNYGINNEEVESDSIKIAGLICKNFSYEYSREKSDGSLEEFFEKNKEAFFYKNKEALIDTASHILNLPKKEAQAIRENARLRSVKSGYNYKDRAKQVAIVFEEILRNKKKSAAIL